MIELMLVMTLWGTLGVFVLWSGLPAIEVAFYRCLIGAAVMGFWLLRSGEKIRPDKSTATVSLAGICLVLNWVFLFKSFQVSSITIGNMSYYLQPIILIILGIFIYQEKVSLKKWGLILMSLVGVLLTIDLRNLVSPNSLLGAGFALLAALLYSFVTLLMKKITLDHIRVIFIQLTIGAFVLLPFVHFHKISNIAVACLAMVGLVHTLLAYFLYYSAIKKTSFTQIAILSYLDPIVAIGTDVVFFQRTLNLWQMTGIGLTFGALYLLVVSSKKSAQKDLQFSSENKIPSM